MKIKIRASALNQSYWGYVFCQRLVYFANQNLRFFINFLLNRNNYFIFK